jgi:hypothetical protein
MIKTTLPSDIKIVKEDCTYFYFYGPHPLVSGPLHHLSILDDFIDKYCLLDFIYVEGFLIDIENECDMTVARKCIKYFGEKSIFGCIFCKSNTKLRVNENLIIKYM